MSYIDLYEYCAPTPKNIVPIIIVSILYFIVFKLIKFLKIKKRQDNNE
jgi:Ni/Fe-hydrogenase subunit HybB-like protein